MQNLTVGNQTFQGYLSLPATGTGAGILLCHAWWGLNDFFQRLCDRLAAEGFIVLAPDLFHGDVAQTIGEATALPNQVDRKLAKREVRAALDYLAAHESVTGSHLGAIGFSYGAAYALECARLRPKLVNAVTLFYGTGGGKFDKTAAEFQGHFAATDEWGADSKKVEKLKERIKSENQEVQFYTYPDTTHWFFESDQHAYDADAANVAWLRTVEFMRDRLVTK